MGKKKIVILTGSELRHDYFRKTIAACPKIKVLASFCEGDEQSLYNRTKENYQSSSLEYFHIDARTQSEQDFFYESSTLLSDTSNPIKIKKGKVNDQGISDQIKSLNPDLLVCYGASLIKSDLLSLFKGRFLNVHLGLSPYYRGSGTNVWPLINGEPHMVGATFMYIDEGIDTGKIIHQLRPNIFLGDSPHTIGNRIIRLMTEEYSRIITHFDNLNNEVQPDKEGNLYFQKDFNSDSCEKLYFNFRNGMIEDYLNLIEKSEVNFPYIVRNSALENIS